MSSFPVPVSPSMRTVESVGATCSTWSRTHSRAALLPMIRSNLRSAWSPAGYITFAKSATRYSFQAPHTIAITYCSHIKCSSNRFEQQLMIERFREELDRAFSHRLNPHPGISVSSNKDDWDIAFFFFKPGLQLQPGHLRHTDINNQARSPSMQIGFKELFR